MGFKSIIVCLSVLHLCGFITNAQESVIIPLPREVKMQTGNFALVPNTRICYAPGLKNEALYLQRIIQTEHQLTLKIDETKKATPTSGNIYLSLTAGAVADSREAYDLMVDEKNILISSSGQPGVFYGIQSLRQIISANKVPSIAITDAPVFKWRAFLLDEGRYFKGMQAVKDILDEMALLKMNVFHWHLTDDQGWRIEIKKYPLLTEIGSKRKQSELGTWLSNVFDGKPHEGFYTQQQIREIIQYASQRHITIIPEIEMPGHASSAIAAYPWLDSDTVRIEVPSSFGIKLNVFNVADKRVQQFLHDVLDEVMALFPSNMVHIGGDEVKFDHWKASPQVMEYIRQNNLKSPADLQISFTNGIARYLEQHQHRMIGWNDVLGNLHGNNDSLDTKSSSTLTTSAIIQFWTGDPEIVTQAALKGHDVINSYWVNTYIDYDYKSHPTELTYNFQPIPASLPANLHHKVLGLGVQMWGEWIPTVKDMNYKIYPRIAALAEVGWTPPDKKNFDRFKQSLNNYLIPSWKKKGITILPEQLITPPKTAEQ